MDIIKNVLRVNKTTITLYIISLLILYKYSVFTILDQITITILFIYDCVKNITMNDKVEDQEIKIQNLELNNKLISNVDDNMKCFRHDFFNFLQALEGYTQTNNIEGIRKMNDSILKECEEIINMETLNPNLVMDPGVYNILVKKYFLAQKENIKMNIDIYMDVCEAKISSYKLCKILGILLDNAIEAAKECEEKVINVRFEKDTERNRKLIIIENSYNSVDIDINKIFEKGYSTKENKKSHGLGLWTIRKILSSAENLNLFTKKGRLFSQQLEIYN